MKQETKTLHPRNLHNQRYDFDKLIETLPSLKEYVFLNKYNDLSIDFSNPSAVLMLNKALLLAFYKIEHWDIPKDYLCPPIPGRADYIHYLADLLAKSNNNIIPRKNIFGLDIGTGANCIYPIIGSSVYDWNFLASDIDSVSISNVNNLIESNKNLSNKITCVEQIDLNSIFDGVINDNDKFDFTMCNPPFHKSKKDASLGSQRKVSNLTKDKNRKMSLNFGGQSNELWCKGGELKFIKTMIMQSEKYKNNCCWFSTLVSKKENLGEIYKSLDKLNPSLVETIEMKHGNKITRFVAWTFLSKKSREDWFKNK